MIVRSPYDDIDVPDTGLPEFLFGDLGDAAERVAIIDGPSGAQTTFGELAAAVDRFAAGMGERGLGPGDVIALFAPNNPYYPVVFHGALAAGLAVSTVNALYTPDELAYQLRDSGSKVLVTVSAFLDRARAALDEEGLAVSEIIVIDGAPSVSGVITETSLSEVLATTAERPSVSLSGDDVAALPYSSGTTGRAKGVVLTHRNLLANLLQIEKMGTHVSPDTKILAVLPFFHIYGMTVMMNQGLHARAAVVTMPKFDLAEFLRIISEHRVDRVYIAPPIAVALAKHPMVDQYDIDCVDIVFSGAAALDAELGAAVGRRLNCTMLQGYGMTELSPVSHCMPDDRPDMDLGSIGVALPSVECKLVDPDTGAEGVERGELWVRGPNVMREYLNNAEATASTLDADGFLHTGDVATVTDEGVFYIVDRVKELIKYKGYQVPPAELEALLLTNDGIADAAVIGVKDAEGEEIPKAFVVLQQGAELSGDDVMSFVAERIAPHKKVRVVEFIDQIPKSASGKILRKDLRAREQAPA
ncbi:acyl-CoA synthetase (AMP-forming)/AMP-acid ligase II [Actinomycetospora succinea]|uniref:Acyl-CoA synthetase (AMP-forming)/AMP-acid ligase II n=1 Tax=Actinomycetospora succinea TaxID=663603 RepID=A0A4V3D769_9PSEU|nr:AMP-binding protein [Actinomycetospora succinea]TDQ46737.1 acyl-CoA synthetase (AMP-forming)/AMP-acid ligase II [Actinomycetospora succinea]